MDAAQNTLPPPTRQAPPRDPRLVCADNLADFPPLDWLLKDRILNHALNIIFGSSGTIKSFLQIYWALQIAQTVNVVYVVGEGLYGIPKRLRACADYYGLSTTNFYLWQEPISLMDPKLVTRDFLAKVFHLQPALIVIDTLSKCMAGGDESSTRDMTIAMDTCALISRRLNGCAVSVVHHKGWDTSRERGSTVLRASADYMIETVRKDKTLPFISLKCSKAKDDTDTFKTVVTFQPHLDSAIVVESAGVDFIIEVDDFGLLDADELATLQAIMDTPRVKATELVPTLRLSRATTYRILDELKARKFIASHKGCWSVKTAGFRYLESLEKSAPVSAETNAQKSHEKSQEKTAKKSSQKSQQKSQQADPPKRNSDNGLGEASHLSQIVSNGVFETETLAKVSAVSPPYKRGEAETASESGAEQELAEQESMQAEGCLAGGVLTEDEALFDFSWGGS